MRPFQQLEGRSSLQKKENGRQNYQNNKYRKLIGRGKKKKRRFKNFTLFQVKNLFLRKKSTTFFRDARPVFLSRRNANELPAYYLDIADYCSAKLEQFNFFIQNPALHHRLKFQTFEDLAKEPETVAKKIYDFIKWEIPANLHSWIHKNTRETSGFRFFD
jgi:hypothetical protein